MEGRIAGLAWIETRVADPRDSQDERRRKALFTLATLVEIPAGALWGLLYLAFHEPLAAAFPGGFAIASVLNLLALLRFHRYDTFRRAQQVMTVFLPFALQLSLGGFVGGSAAIVWAFTSVLLGALFGSTREAAWWFGGFVSAVVVALLLQPQLTYHNHLPTWLVIGLFCLNILGVAVVAFVVLRFFVTDRQKLRELEAAYLNQDLALRRAEKLATLGTLAAGLTHELNNPAAAASRGAGQLQAELARLQALYRASLDATSAGLSTAIHEVDVALGSRSTEALGPLDRSYRTEELEDWLRSARIEDPEQLAPELVEAGLVRGDLDDVSRSLAPADIEPLVTYAASSAAVGQLLAEIGEATGRISGLVDAMKSYSYLDQGLLQRVDVNEAVESTLELLGARLGPGVTVVREYGDSLPSILASGSELNQVWTNLVQNAVDAMNGEGTLTIRTRSTGETVVVDIEDSGPGMSTEVARRAFDPFFTTKPPGKGTGLGLATALNIVEQKHGGRIEIDSEPGRTTVRVALPLDVAGAEGGPAIR